MHWQQGGPCKLHAISLHVCSEITTYTATEARKPYPVAFTGVSMPCALAQLYFYAEEVTKKKTDFFVSLTWLLTANLTCCSTRVWFCRSEHTGRLSETGGRWSAIAAAAAPAAAQARFLRLTVRDARPGVFGITSTREIPRMEWPSECLTKRPGLCPSCGYLGCQCWRWDPGAGELFVDSGAIAGGWAHHAWVYLSSNASGWRDHQAGRGLGFCVASWVQGRSSGASTTLFSRPTL